jgi:hypothetical protein
MQAVSLLTGLDPKRSSNPRGPLSSGLIGALVDMATTPQERLGLADEFSNGRRADLFAAMANVHTQSSRRTVDHPDASSDFIRGKLSP